MSEEAAVSELDRLEAAAGECREMIREAHAATKDLRAAVREAKRELQDLAKDEVAAQIQREVSRQLEELGERTTEAVSAATQKVIAEFDRFGESPKAPTSPSGNCSTSDPSAYNQPRCRLGCPHTPIMPIRRPPRQQSALRPARVLSSISTERLEKSEGVSRHDYGHQWS